MLRPPFERDISEGSDFGRVKDRLWLETWLVRALSRATESVIKMISGQSGSLIVT